MHEYLELTKPRLASLVLVTTAAGVWLGLRTPQPFWLWAHAIIGTALVVGGANALNQWWERELDARMERTKRRPLPAGRLAPARALSFGIALSVAGVLWLWLGTNGLAATLAAVSWITYVLVYTPLKRTTPLCTLIGAIPGALPPLIGWTAARGSLGLEGWTLFGILFAWQLPHFLALAVMYRDDYARAGFSMLSLSNGDATRRQIILYGALLVPLSLFPTMVGLAGAGYFSGALILSGLFFAAAVRAVLRHSPAALRQLFRASIVYLPLLLILLAADRRPLLTGWP